MAKAPWMKDKPNTKMTAYVLDDEKRAKLKPIMLKLADFLIENTEGPMEAYALLHEMGELVLQYSKTKLTGVVDLPAVKD